MKERIIPNQRIAPCTKLLKIRPFRRYLYWLSTTQDSDDWQLSFSDFPTNRPALRRLLAYESIPVIYNKQANFSRIWLMDWAEFVKYEKNRNHTITIHIGFDFKEQHRCSSVQKNYQKLGYRVDFPLLWKPYEYRPYTEVSQSDWGINPPRTYLQGYKHANCLGADLLGRGGCVKLGKGDRIRQLTHQPQIFKDTADWERAMRFGVTGFDYSLLRHHENGERKTMTLFELQKSQSKANALPLKLLDMTDSCVRCGVGDVLGTA